MNVNSISSRDAVSASVQRKHLILYPDGREMYIESKNPESVDSAIEALKEIDPVLSKFAESEMRGGDAGSKPVSIDLMRRLELVDYEPASDAGHFRFYPDGTLILDSLIEWINGIAVSEMGAMKIETPLLYDWSNEDIREQGESFHERHYIAGVKGNRKKELVLRFAGDFGLFRMMKDLKLSHRNLPMRIYELSKSFRYEKSGELSGLRRMRQFTMPDVHSFTGSVLDGWKEYGELYGQYEEIARDMNVDYAIVVRVVESFYLEYRNSILDLLKRSGRPAFVELLGGMKHYWAIKHEFQGIDASANFCQLSTVQLDVVDSERYGISYADSDGERKWCVICHSSIGSLERWIYVLLEKASQMERPMLPFWLSPTQVRIIPMGERYMEGALNLQRNLSNEGFRCDIDDREITMQKKVMNAQQKWVPVIIVYGRKEEEAGLLSVTLRESGNIASMKPEELSAKLRKLVKGKPELSLYTPVLLSRRPRFQG